MKKYVIWLLMLGLVFLAACGEAPEGTTEEPFVIQDASEAAAIMPEEAVIGIIVPNLDSAGMETLLTELKSKMTGDGILSEHMILVEWNGEAEQKEQEEQKEETGVQSLLKQGADLILAGESGEQNADITDACSEAGIPVIFFYEQPSLEDQDAYTDELTDLMIKYLNGEISDSYSDMK